MKLLFSISFSLLSFFALAQLEAKKTLQVNPSDEVLITGKIKNDITIGAGELYKFGERKMGDVPIFSNLGAIKGTARDLKGVLLKDILSKIDIQAENEKVLSEFYITCIATDGYKVVYSWNEIFNSDTGENVYLITEKEEIKAAEMTDRILMISTKDYKTGRRYVKGLQKIVIERVN